jgi:hypothetical protein
LKYCPERFAAVLPMFAYVCASISASVGLRSLTVCMFVPAFARDETPVCPGPGVWVCPGT